jgi:hypothetical protein
MKLLIIVSDIFTLVYMVCATPLRLSMSLSKLLNHYYTIKDTEKGYQKLNEAQITKLPDVCKYSYKIGSC